ncbi:Galactoside-binding lectin [Popillia japonica]|uniref:Galectin n=1 Tax=Popillia japonica TaxID=7064 RepID=A0AAW1N7T2_POPJA
MAPMSYNWPLLESLKPGHLVRIRGCIIKEGKRFNVNFQNEFDYGKSDLMLQLSMRYADGVGFIVNNSRNENGWMAEDMHRNMNFEPGINFELLILCDFDKFQIALDGNRICNYPHRLPFSDVKCIGIKGEVTLNLISLEDNNNPGVDIAETDYRNTLSLAVVPKKKLKRVVRCRVS